MSYFESSDKKGNSYEAVRRPTFMTQETMFVYIVTDPDGFFT
jgi:hypothetical protein